MLAKNTRSAPHALHVLLAIVALTLSAAPFSCGDTAAATSTEDAGVVETGTVDAAGSESATNDGGSTDGGPSDGAPSDGDSGDAARGPLTVLGQPSATVNQNLKLGVYQPAQLSTGGGKLVAADSGNNRVLVWSSIPTTAGVAPDLVLGQTDLSLSKSSATPSATTLDYPTGVWTDGTRLVVTDFINNRVLVWKTFPTTNGQAADFALGQPAGVANLTNNTANNGGVTGSGVNQPSAVASNGTALFVADYGNHRVLGWNTFPTTPAAADFALGQPAGGPNLTSNTANNGGPSGGSLYGPTGIAIAGTQLFVADEYNSRVLAWSSIPSAPVAASFALGQPSGGANLTSTASNNGGISGSTLYNPWGVAAGNGQLFVSDLFNNRVLVWNALPSSPSAANFALGQPDLNSSAPNNGGVSGNSMYGPEGALVVGGKLFVSDGVTERILVWNAVPSSAASADYALGTPPGPKNLTSSGANNGTGASGSTMYWPNGVYSDGTRLFVTDLFNSRTLVWSTMPAVDGQSATFALGQAAGANNLSSTLQAAGASGMNLPRGGIFVHGTTLFVADSNNNRVLVWNTLPTGAQPADFALGQPTGTTNLTATAPNNGGISGSSVNYPTSIWSDGTKLFVVDLDNHRVLVWTSIPSAPVAASFALGQPDLTTNTANNGGVSGSSMSRPSGVFTMGGALYVADSANNRVLIWSSIPAAAAAASMALGQGDLMTATAATTSTGMSGPTAVHGDGTRLYVADAVNNRVLVWSTPPTSAGQAASSVIGQPDFTHNDPNGGPTLGLTAFYGPCAVFADGTRLFVADQYNNRVVVIPQ
jgi:hypothetical protein